MVKFGIDSNMIFDKDDKSVATRLSDHDASLLTKLTLVAVPTSSTSTGLTGQIAVDANYIYMCTSTNTWKRTPLTTW
jgi:heme/copper-type cytochrome/quinol oxidase subunit 1